MSRVKIVATIGPRTKSPDSVRALRGAGMDVARFNGSHADLDWHREAIGVLRSVAPEVPILFDIPGRKIRVGQLKGERSFNVNETVVFTTDADDAGESKVPVTNSDLHRYVTAGSVILADEGTIRFTVSEVNGRNIICRGDHAGVLRSSKGINIPAVLFKQDPVSGRDRQMIAFAKEQGVDFVGISFVGRAEHVDTIRSLIGKGGPQVVAKIETQEAIHHLEEVVKASDVLMIDRGDLSAETELESVSLLQKQILRLAREEGKPVIVATDMLQSMMQNPFPSKAEVSDISNAVLDGAAALMLSGETAIGNFPVEAVALMRRVADTVAEHVQHSLDEENNDRVREVPQAMADAVALVCRRLPVTKIVAITISGYAARIVAMRMPRQPILAVSNNRGNARSFNMLPGTEGVYIDIPFSRTSTDHIAHCLKELWRLGKLTDEDVVLVTSVGYPKSGNRMNLIQTHNVADLKESLGWR